MLLRFNFENAFCFLTEASLSMVPSGDKRHANHIRASSRPGAAKTLRAAGIYGANGHGKTKLVDAILFMKRMACGGDDDAIKNFFAPFKLQKSAAEKPSRFVIEFRVQNTDFEYGLIIQNAAISQEWLFERTNRKEALLFSRERSGGKNPKEAYQFEFGPKLIRSKSPSSKFSMSDYLNFVAAGVDETETLLSLAVSKKVDRLKTCFSWFCDTLQIVKADARYSKLHAHAAADKKFLEYLSGSLCRSDTGIFQLRLKKTEAPEDFVDKLTIASDPDILAAIKGISEDEGLVLGSSDGPSAVVQREKEGYSLLEFVTVHKSEGGEVEFDLKDESSGTRRLMDLYPMLYSLTEGDQVFIVDELDRKLHPLLAYEFVKSFLENSKGQLVFTTHTTHLLDLELLRRDEIWLVQKRSDGSSELYSLNDFKVRPDLDVRKGYLQGRFGGIPFIGDAKALGWC